MGRNGSLPPSQGHNDTYGMETHYVRTRRDLENIYPRIPLFIEENTRGSGLTHIRKPLATDKEPEDRFPVSFHQTRPPSPQSRQVNSVLEENLHSILPFCDQHPIFASVSQDRKNKGEIKQGLCRNYQEGPTSSLQWVEK